MGFLKRLLGKKEKEVEKPSFSGPRFPSPGKEKEWMSSKLDHYKKHNPEHAHHLFSPASGDYLPTAVHVGSTAWHRNHEAHKMTKTLVDWDRFQDLHYDRNYEYRDGNRFYDHGQEAGTLDQFFTD